MKATFIEYFSALLYNKQRGYFDLIIKGTQNRKEAERIAKKQGELIRIRKVYTDDLHFAA